MVDSLSVRYLGVNDFAGGAAGGEAGSSKALSKDALDEMSRKHFPLCMRTLYTKLKEDSHLKHSGRMQLGLFLKGAGLPLDEALAFWRHEFTKNGKMNNEQWEKARL